MQEEKEEAAIVSPLKVLLQKNEEEKSSVMNRDFFNKLRDTTENQAKAKIKELVGEKRTLKRMPI